MNYFLVNINEENKIWRKYITFDELFLYKSKKIDFKTAHIRGSKIDKLKIEALSTSGDVIKNQSHFGGKKMSNFFKIENMLMIKEDIINVELFSDIKGIKFIDIEVNGKFDYGYKLLSFTNVIDCVDFSKSVKHEYSFSMPTLIESKIPKDEWGFFLSDWSRFGEYYCIVSEELKNTLLQLEKALEFLIFDELTLSDQVL